MPDKRQNTSKTILVLKEEWREYTDEREKLKTAYEILDEVSTENADCVTLWEKYMMHLARGEEEPSEAVKSIMYEQCNSYPEVMVHKDSSCLVTKLKHITGYPFDLKRQNYKHIQANQEFDQIMSGKNLCELLSPGQCRLLDNDSYEIFVEAYLNGQGPYTLQLDSGGGREIVLRESIARELGIEPIVSSAMLGITGKQQCGLALLDQLQMGDIQMQSVPVNIISQLDGGEDGTLGFEIFEDYRIVINNKENTFEAMNSSPKLKHRGVKVEWGFLKIDNVMVVNCELGGDTYVGVLDTGAQHICASRRLGNKYIAQHPNASSSSEKTVVSAFGRTAEKDSLIIQDVEIRINSFNIKLNVLLTLESLDHLGDYYGVPLDLIIGWDFFSKPDKVIIDYPQRKILIVWKDKPTLLDWLGSD